MSGSSHGKVYLSFQAFSGKLTQIYSLQGGRNYAYAGKEPGGIRGNRR